MNNVSHFIFTHIVEELISDVLPDTFDHDKIVKLKSETC